MAEGYRECRNMWKVFSLFLVFMESVHCASSSCTIVQNVTVVSGGTAELLCQINHDRNDPSKTKEYDKKWNRLLPPNLSRQVYVYIVQDKTTVILDTAGNGNGFDYRGRAVRTSNDVVKLSNVTQQDGGTYSCSWFVQPGITGCADAKTEFTVTVIDPVSNVKTEVTSPKKEKEITTFRCSASGTPTITYAWQKVGGVIPHDRWTDHGDGSATLSNIQRADAGKYRCTADNDANKPQTSDVTLEVYYAPTAITLTSSPSSLTQQENSEVTLTCTADGGYPAPDVAIYRGGVKVIWKRRLNRSDHQVAYVCKATGGGILNEMTSNEIKYNVLFPPSTNDKKESPPGSVAVGNQKSLTCTTDSANPPSEITWMRDGTAVTDHVVTSNPNGENNAKETSSTITITTAKDHNGNEYACIVKQNSNEIISLKKTFKLNVTFPPDQVSISQSPPGPVRHGTTKTLTCSTDSANPAAEITWTRDDSYVTESVKTDKEDGQYKAFIITSTVTIETTKAHNENLYKCKVSHMNQEITKLDKSFHLNVTFPHDVTVSATLNPVVEGSDTTLTCQPSGGNPVTVQSYEWKGPSPVATTSSVIGSSHQLTLTNTSYKHAGKYSCSATNMGGTGSGSTDLQVLYSAKLDPSVTHTQKISAEYNQTVTFMLKVIANPTPSYEWFRSHDNTEMSLLEKSKVNSKGLTSNLTIPMTQKEDMISYICKVKNSVGLKVFNFILSPAAPPDQPIELKIHYKSAVSVTLNWIAGFNGGFTQIFVLMYRIAGQPWPQHPQITDIPDPGENKAVMYKVQNLTENTAYEFRVRAENERQNGQRTSEYTKGVQGKTKDKPTVTGNKLTVLRKARSTVATATWSEPQGHYTDINIRYCEKPDRVCDQHVVNTSVSTTQTEIRNLDANILYTYMLQLYDGGDLVFSTAKTQSSIPDPPSNTVTVVAAVLGSLFAIIIMVVVVLGLVVYKRRNQGASKKKKVPTATLR